MGGKADGAEAAAEHSHSVLEPFWSLSEADITVRLGAVRELLENPAVRDPASADHQYVVKRLARGLSSSHGVSRQGFSVALTQLLRACDKLDHEALMKLLLESTEVSNAIRGEELREKLFGRLFGFLALVRSGICTENADMLLTIVSKSLEISKKKAWIEEFAVETACDAIEAAEKKQLRAIVKNLGNFSISSRNVRDLSPAQLSLICSLNLAATASKKVRKALEENDKVPIWVPSLTSAEKQATFFDEVIPVLVKACHTAPRLHSVWRKVLKVVLLRGSVSGFTAFWAKVSEALIVDTGRERKFIAVHLFEEAMRILIEENQADSLADVLVNGHIRRVLLVSATNKETMLHQTANATLVRVGSLLQQDGVPVGARAAVIKVLQLDNDTHKKLVSSLVTGASDNQQDASAKFERLKLECRACLAKEEKATWTISMMMAVVKSATESAERWRLNVDLALFLIEEGMFEFADRKLSMPFHNECVAVFHKVLLNLISMEKLSLRKRGKQASEDGGVTLSSSVVQLNEHFQLLLADKKRKCVLELGEAEQLARESALAASSKLRAAQADLTDANARELSTALVLVLEHLALQAFILGVKDGSSEVNIDIVELLEDLVTVTNRLAAKHDLFGSTVRRSQRRKSTKSNAPPADEGESNGDEPDEMGVFTDLLIATLAQPSAVLRNVISAAYGAASSYVNVPAIDVIFDVLQARGHELTPKQEHNSDDESEDEDMIDQDNAAREGAEEKEGADEEEGADESDASSSDDEDAEMTDDVKTAAQNAMAKLDADGLAKVLGENAPLFNDDGGDEENATDAALAEFVKMNVARKQQLGKKARIHQDSEKITLKLRVLDLLDVVSEGCPSPEIASLLPGGLFRTARSCFLSTGKLRKGNAGVVSMTLFKRVSQSIFSLIRAAKSLDFSTATESISLPEDGACLRTLKSLGDESGDSLDSDAVELPQVLRLTLKAACAGQIKTINREMSTLAANITDLIVSICARYDVLPMDEVVAVYEPILEAELHKAGSSNNTATITKLLNKHQAFSAALAPLVFEHACSPVNNFARLNALDLVSTCIKSPAFAASNVQERCASAFKPLAACFAHAAKLEDDKILRPKNLRHAIKLGNEIKRVSKKHEVDLPKEEVSALATSIKTLIDACGGKVQKALRASLAQLLESLCGEVAPPAPVEQKKRKRDAAGDSAQGNEPTEGAAKKKNKKAKTDKTPQKQGKTPQKHGKTPQKQGKTPQKHGKTPQKHGKTPKKAVAE